MTASMLSAQICGILGLAGLAIFIIGGKQDNDGQGTNPSVKKPWEVSSAQPQAADPGED